MRGEWRTNRGVGLLLVVLALAGPIFATRPEAAGRVGIAAERDGRIVGGVPVPEGRLTFTTAIMLKTGSLEYQFCGGSLIAPQYVLTAGHCMYQRAASQLKVYVGANNLHDLSRAKVSDVERIIIHPKYDDDSVTYDVALLQLPAPGITGIEPVGIAVPGSRQGVQPDDMVSVVGWGDLTEDGPSSDQLMRIDVFVQPDAYCQSRYDLPDREIAVVFCAGVRGGGQDACTGDSGGPAFHGGPFTDPPVRIQVGVVSYGDGCARPGNPGAYARLAAPEINAFIRQHVPLDPSPGPALDVRPARLSAISPGARLSVKAERPGATILQVDFLSCDGHNACPEEERTLIAADSEAPWAAELPNLPAGNATLVTRIWSGPGAYEDVVRPVYVQNPPDVQIRMPKDGAKSGRKVRFQVAAPLAENGVASVTLQECAGAACIDLAIDERDPWAFEIAAAPGAHVYRAVAVDGAGNAGTSAPVSVTVKRKK